MDESLDLIRKAHHGDKYAREQVVSQNMGLVWSIVRRFLDRGVELEDLFQIGMIGLLKAVDKFDLSYEVRFSTYAVPVITGEIKRFLRDDGMIKVSRSYKELCHQALQAKSQLYELNGKEPTLEEVASHLSVKSEDLVFALESQTQVESLQKTVYQRDGDTVFLQDKLRSQEEPDEQILDKIMIEHAMKEMPPRDQLLIQMRYFMDRTQMEIAEQLGVSQVQISRMEKKILSQMRKIIETGQPNIQKGF